MAIMANNTSTFTRELTPAGMHMARCYMMVHIGTVQETIQGKKATLNKVLIGWELPNLTKVYNEQRGPEVMTFLREFTLSLGDKATLRKLLASWRGRDFTKDELENFDITKVLGVPCCLNIIHTPKKSAPQELRDDLTAAVPLMAGAVMLPAVNKVVKFEWDMPNWELFGGLPGFVQGKIKVSDEFKRYVAQHGMPAQLAQQAVAQPQVYDSAQQAQQAYSTPVHAGQPVWTATGWQQPGQYQPPAGYQQSAPVTPPTPPDNLPF